MLFRSFHTFNETFSPKRMGIRMDSEEAKKYKDKLLKDRLNLTSVEFNNKRVVLSSLKIEGIDLKDWPKFTDAFATYAEYQDGTVLNRVELENFNDECHIVIHQYIWDEQLYLNENFHPRKVKDRMNTPKGKEIIERKEKILKHLSTLIGKNVKIPKIGKVKIKKAEKRYTDEAGTFLNLDVWFDKPVILDALSGDRSTYISYAYDENVAQQIGTILGCSVSTSESGMQGDVGEENVDVYHANFDINLT